MVHNSISTMLSPLLLLFLFLFLFTLPTPTLQQSNKTTTTDFNYRLQNAYRALQAWKDAITSDPNDFTSNWVGYNVCSYRGVYCAPALDDPSIITVAGIDLNHASLTGTLPLQLAPLLPDLALLHLNSNHFFGPIPYTFAKLKLLFELDISNNNFCGEFPSVLFNLTTMKFLDIRFNHFNGAIPPEIFQLKLDALFLNNNNFTSYTPGSVGSSPVSVMVMGNNNLNRCFPPRISRMRKTLDEVILTNCGLTGCLPKDIGKLSKATVFDVSFNDLTGTLPESMGRDMESVEELNVGDNSFYGKIPSSICNLPRLENFTYSHNFFVGEAPQCLKIEERDDTFNCIPHRPLQKSPMECEAFLSYPPKCSDFSCNVTSSPQSPPPTGG